MQVVSEVRHFDGVKGNFAVTRTEYVSYAISEEVRPSLIEVVRSTSQVFIQQQQFFFETLWERAIPAEKRVREIEEGTPVEVTEIWYDSENITEKTLKITSKAKVSSDICNNSKSPSIFVTNPRWLRAMMELKGRGIRHRFLTEITKENVQHCKELAKYAELRHLDDVKGNFAIIDGKEYGATPNISEFQRPTELVHTNVKQFVEQQQYFFETLWNKAIPSKQRIKEIEKGVKREFVETIRDPLEIQKIRFDLITAAEKRYSYSFLQQMHSDVKRGQEHYSC
ncbi:MAG: hypothetical protein M3258_05405 [Thermoproteota archaeon]|nr:hypothetical protein [Thermoproteota archaeon]